MCNKGEELMAVCFVSKMIYEIQTNIVSPQMLPDFSTSPRSLGFCVPCDGSILATKEKFSLTFT